MISSKSLRILPALVATCCLGQQTVTKPAITPAPKAQQPASAPASTVTAPAAPVTPVAPGYVIGPEDSLQINVWKEPGISATLPVRPDGNISLALIGDVPAAGLTPMQLGQSIASRLTSFITDPTVTVTVLGVNSKRIYMLGEIGRVGPLPLTPAMTILQAIATAGGLSGYADAKHIYILRGESGR